MITYSTVYPILVISIIRYCIYCPNLFLEHTVVSSFSRFLAMNLNNVIPSNITRSSTNVFFCIVVEQNADIAVNKLLKQNKEPLAQLLELEKLEEERIINAATECASQLRKHDILNAMQDLIEQETKSFYELSQIRSETAQNILER